MPVIDVSDLTWPRAAAIRSAIAASGCTAIIVAGPATGRSIWLGASRDPRQRLWQIRADHGDRVNTIYWMRWAYGAGKGTAPDRIVTAARAAPTADHAGRNWYGVYPHDAIATIDRAAAEMGVVLVEHDRFIAAINAQHEALAAAPSQSPDDLAASREDHAAAAMVRAMRDQTRKSAGSWVGDEILFMLTNH